MTTADLQFMKARTGEYRGSPAVIVSDRTGAPFFWVTGTSYRDAIRKGIAFFDAALIETTKPEASP